MTAPDLDLEALREVVANGTPGQWVYVGQGCFESYIDGQRMRGCAQDADDMLDPIVGVHRFKDEYGDAPLIVAAVNALPVLLDEVQRLRVEKSRAFDNGFAEAAERGYEASVALTADRDRLRERAEKAEAAAVFAYDDNGMLQQVVSERDEYQSRLAKLEAERDQLLNAGRQFGLADTSDECRCGHGRAAHVCTFAATRCFGCGCNEYRPLPADTERGDQ